MDSSSKTAWNPRCPPARRFISCCRRSKSCSTFSMFMATAGARFFPFRIKLLATRQLKIQGRIPFINPSTPRHFTFNYPSTSPSSFGRAKEFNSMRDILLGLASYGESLKFAWGDRRTVGTWPACLAPWAKLTAASSSKRRVCKTLARVPLRRTCAMAFWLQRHPPYAVSGFYATLNTSKCAEAKTVRL